VSNSLQLDYLFIQHSYSIL